MTVTDWLHKSTAWARKNSAPAFLLHIILFIFSYDDALGSTKIENISYTSDLLLAGMKIFFADFAVTDLDLQVSSRLIGPGCPSISWQGLRLT